MEYATLEFKKYHGKHFLMEINPRPWSWNSIIDYAGINLPYIACNTILNPTSKILYRQKKNIKEHGYSH